VAVTLEAARKALELYERHVTRQLAVTHWASDPLMQTQFRQREEWSISAVGFISGG